MAKHLIILLLLSVLLSGAINLWRPLAPADSVGDREPEAEPTPTYGLTFWVTHPIIPTTAVYKQAIESIVAEFMAAEQNVDVETVFMRADALPARLREALTQGTPPDILLDTESRQVDYGELQIHLGNYLTKSEKALHSANAIGQASARGKMVGLPVGFSYRVFMANPRVFRPTETTLERITSHGWTWEQFLQSIANSTDDIVLGLVLTDIGTPLLQTLAASFGAPSPFDQMGRRAWSVSTIQSMATVWERLAAVPRLTGMNTVNERSLVQFLDGKAALIGPLNPMLTTWLTKQDATRKITPVLLPMPSGRTSSFADLRAVNLVAFRHRKVGTANQARAAAEFAKFAAPRLSLILREHLGLLPYPTPPSEPGLSSMLVNGTAATSITSAPAVPFTFGPEVGADSRLWEETIAPLWMAFQSGELTAEEFTASVIAALP